jgi:hypothetical protein
MWYHYGKTTKVVAIADTVVKLQQQYQQQNPIEGTIGFTIKEEHGGCDGVTSGSFF